ncbi:MAG: hypothetical protein GF309_06520 [Candidatus Lokiarchaeota archaeon]|nr:hypothetical protein [Candidatus Lokiarchaeota archaeon]
MHTLGTAHENRGGRGVRNRKKRFLGILCIICIGVIPLFASSQTHVANTSQNGPFLNQIVFHDMHMGEGIQALLDDEIQLIDESIDNTASAELGESEHIETAEILRNGYGYLSINCRRYPFNLSSFRRAFAYALDKQKICDEIWGGFAYPHDSVVPRINPFSIENELRNHYYNGNITLANRTLDSGGFADINNDGYREAPNGESFEVDVDMGTWSAIAIEICEIAAQTLRSMGIKAVHEPPEYYEYWGRIPYNYDIVFLAVSFNDFTLDWLGYEYWSEYADETYWNYPKFVNASYDSWIDQLLHAVEYEKVYEAATNMQEILLEQCPVVVCYESFNVAAYRNDRFGGFVNDVAHGPSNFWSSLKIHLRDERGGLFGGTLHWSDFLIVRYLRKPHSCSDIYYQVSDIFDFLYDSLLRQGPDGNLVCWLAKSYTIQTHADNEAVPVGHTRFTFEVSKNVTWTDGKRLTAHDVVFTFNYFRRVMPWYVSSLRNMNSIYAKTDYTLVLEFETESYWHLHSIASKPIIPRHIFRQLDPEESESCAISLSSDNVTSGPFSISNNELGNKVELTRNPHYFKRYIPPEMDEPTTTTGGKWNAIDVLSPFVLSASMIIFVGTTAICLGDRKEENHSLRH